MRFSEVPGGPCRIDASVHVAGLGTQFSEVDEQLWPLSYPQKSSPTKRVRGSAASRGAGHQGQAGLEGGAIGRGSEGDS